MVTAAKSSINSQLSHSLNYLAHYFKAKSQMHRVCVQDCCFPLFLLTLRHFFPGINDIFIYLSYKSETNLIQEIIFPRAFTAYLYLLKTTGTVNILFCLVCVVVCFIYFHNVLLFYVLLLNLTDGKFRAQYFCLLSCSW